MRKTKLNTILIFVLIITALILSAVIYEYISMKNFGETSSSLNLELKGEQDSVNYFNELSKTAANLKDDSEKANSFFIKRDQIVDFLNLVDTIGSYTNTKISVFSVSEKKAGANQNYLLLSLNISGTYSEVYYATRFLEELPYQTEIKTLKLSRDNSVIDDKKNIKTNLWSAKVDLVGIME